MLNPKEKLTPLYLFVFTSHKKDSHVISVYTCVFNALCGLLVKGLGVATFFPLIYVLELHVLHNSLFVLEFTITQLKTMLNQK